MTSTGIFDLDVANTTYLDAEERGLLYLRRRFGHGSVRDVRASKTHYDILVHFGNSKLQKLDIKADQWFATTGRVAWEDGVAKSDGTFTPGWGHKNLDLVFYIGNGQAVLVDANKQRALVASYGPGEAPATWRRFEKEVEQGTVQGWAIPLEDLRAAGAVLLEGEL